MWSSGPVRVVLKGTVVKLPLPIEDSIDLLNLCLASTYFQYNGKHYKQLHGTAMGLPVSVVVAEIVMQHAVKRALLTCRQKIPLWLRYVDWRHIYRRSQRWNSRFSRPPKRTEHGHPVYQRNRRKCKNPFFRQFGKPRQQRTTNDSV